MMTNWKFEFKYTFNKDKKNKCPAFSIKYSDKDSLITRHRGAPAQSSSQNKKTFHNDCLTHIVWATKMQFRSLFRFFMGQSLITFFISTKIKENLISPSIIG